MKQLAVLTLAVLVTIAGAFALPPSSARADIDVRSDAATNQFPNGIQFTIFLASETTISEARLRFRVLPDGVNASVRGQCTPGQVMNCQAVVGSVAQSYMVPGAEVVYSWEFVDEGGDRFTTEERTTVYEDPRFEWESLTDDNLTVYYYFGTAEQQQAVLNAARDTIENIGALLETTIDFPVKVWVYQTARDLQPAVASRRGQGDNRSIQTLGEVGASDTALVSRDTEFLDVVRHELAHVVTRAATRGHLVDIPIWINEGISGYAQNAMLPGEEVALRTAIQRNAVLPITSLGASSRGAAGVVSLFYAQSGSIIKYMVETHGPERFAEFIRALARDNTSGALQSVYGFDLLGLENEWRESVGLPPVTGSGGGSSQQPIPTVAPIGSQPAAEATATPTGQSQAQPNPTPVPQTQPQATPGASDGGGISLLVIAGGLGVLLVLMLAAAGFLVLKSSRTSA